MIDEAGQIFLQEATELVAALERDLLALETSPDDSELVNAAFRSLHTLKGSGAMFGYTAMSAFLHEFETAFDRVRQGDVALSPAIVAAALAACDRVLPMISDPDSESAAAQAVLETLARAMPGGEGAAPAAQAEAAPENAAPVAEALRFRLPPDVVKLGHDPSMLLDELRELAPAQVQAITDRIAPLETLDPLDFLVGWRVAFETPVLREAIEDVFMFHGDDLELTLEGGHAAPAAPSAPVEAKGTATPEAAPSNPASGAPAKVAPAAGETMRVATERLDELMDRVGELVIVEARLQALAAQSRDPALLAVAEDIERLAAGLRSATMSMRMVPIGSITGRFRRLVRDLSAMLEKPIHFEVSGEETELDKTMIDLIADPLVHLLRNSADHGLESAEARRAAGKPEGGTVRLSAAYAGAEVLITLTDDGRGLDPGKIRARAEANGLISPDAQLSERDLYNLIFEPGFSTAAAVTEVSGRGVGMDVVRRTIEQLRGQIELDSEPGHGTTVTLRLPLTLAIIDGLLIEVGGEHYTIPLAAVEECVELPLAQAQENGSAAFLNIRGALVPFLRLRELFHVDAPLSLHPKVVIVQAGGHRIGLVVDRIVSNTQTVIKQLSQLHAHLRGFSGATILGDGRVALVLDVGQIVALGREAEEHIRRESAA
ncbi:two-component system chemotaxis sensor kinase CheA [Rhodobacter aestuarii]|uniref:Chemotaxis protein CheA n=1 Tax=Rhodobacter aestuarii TaxID=453582 RepID=A0A1N7QD40_9RHOB|nr:chemotaxis protein CheA [Rhodobacter aestuarii]PTV93574.1 two-component system chemotaxis sensor kinase CheA [Rhodobacter aestuarii]SIT20782.1 two-component system, chemotaxis family, sensor kinase CheA [Rhodobacter aestuarii]